MHIAQAGESDGFMLVARRNHSLSPAGRKLVLASLFLLTCLISLGFAVHGAWMILPFAGLEMVALCVAFGCLQRHAGDYERLSIRGDRVLIERRERGEVSRHECNRYWARVVLQRCARGQQLVLALRSHGRQVEFGRYLTEQQRVEVAAAIRNALTV